jgi:hypothetical protein
MSYELPDIEEYPYADATFGATTVVHQIIGPKGKVGFVRDLQCDVNVSLVGTTTVPEIDVGISSADSTYGRYRLGPTAVLGYNVGMHRAQNEAFIGNPPRNLQDFAGHVQLDGYPWSTSPQNIVGGSSSTVAPLGRIPASGRTVNNVVSGTAGVMRVYLNQPVIDLVVGQTIRIQGVAGATGNLAVGSLAAGGTNAISAISAAGQGPWIELSGTTFAGTYTAGGVVDIIAFVTNLAGVGGTPAGGGLVRVKIQWVGTNE